MKKKPGLMIGIMAGKEKKGYDEDMEEEAEGMDEDRDEAMYDASGAILDAIKGNDPETLADALMDFISIHSM